MTQRALKKIARHDYAASARRCYLSIKFFINRIAPSIAFSVGNFHNAWASVALPRKLARRAPQVGMLEPARACVPAAAHAVHPSYTTWSNATRKMPSHCARGPRPSGSSFGLNLSRAFHYLQASSARSARVSRACCTSTCTSTTSRPKVNVARRHSQPRPYLAFLFHQGLAVHVQRQGTRTQCA